MIKAVVIDIDGTLINSKHEISIKTKNKLIEIQKQGIKVILASGRPTQGMWRYVDDLELSKYGGFLVSYNGAVITDCQTKKEIYRNTMAVDDAKAVLKQFKDSGFIVWTFKHDYIYVENVFNSYIQTVDTKPFNVLEFETQINNLLVCQVEDLSNYVNWEPKKIIISGEPAELRQRCWQLAEPFKGKLNYVFTAEFYFEFTALNVDKGSALKEALPKYGINADNIIAFGDNQNDIGMIEFAGVGIAMGNGIIELKKKADYITLTNDEDGIVHGLERFL